MGAWGPKLYQDDTALDVKETFISMLKKGKSNIELEQTIINEYAEPFDMDETPIVYFVLADLQWNYGILTTNVKKNALKYISLDLEKWADNKKQFTVRKKILEELKVKINSQQPPAKQVKVQKSFITDWQDGDVYAYKLDSQFAVEKGYKDRYFIFIKCDEMKWYPESIIPIVRVKITNDNNLPKTEEEINDLEYKYVCKILYADRLAPWPHDPKELERRKSFNFIQDEDGRLTEYQIGLILNNKSVKELIYLGNYKNIELPCDEFIPFEKINVQANKFDIIEKWILSR